MHDEIASFGGAGQAGSRVLNLRMIMLGFRDGLAQMFDRVPKRDEPPAAGHRDGLPMRRDQDTTQLCNQHSRYPRRGLPRCHRELQGISIAPEIATLIRARILSETGLTASTGISDNKLLAKLASDHRKPNGQFVITPKMRPAFVQDLPLGKFHGIGPAASAKMNGLSIFTDMDMCNQTLRRSCSRWSTRFGAIVTLTARGAGRQPSK
ncbi:hypothetical protein CQ10_32960 [Bradyrhizobium valentinum]|nr:hypothetical protein CQ10_32960 [Bradyrhizobium valentinum]